MREAKALASLHICADSLEPLLLAKVISEACIGVLGIQGICHFTFRDMGYYAQYFGNFQGY